MSSLASAKAALTFLICLMIAVLLGYLLADPLTFSTMVWGAAILGVLSFPLLLQWHHRLLIITWNASVILVFLPGELPLWIQVAFISLGISILSSTLVRDRNFLKVPSLTLPILFLAAVFLVTAKLTGGIGLRSVGSATFGGRRIFLLFGAVAGYFALTGERIPKGREMLYGSLFFLSGLLAAVGILIYVAPEIFGVLGFFFPVGVAGEEASPFGDSIGIVRLSGLSSVGEYLIFFLLARYGIRGMLLPVRLWRVALFVVGLGFSLLGGFRSLLVLILMLLAIQFYLEKLHRTHLGLVVLLSCGLAFTILAPFAEHLPFPIQRALSFLPVKVNTDVLEDAKTSTEWRIGMWKQLLPEVPHYLLLGKGFNIDPSELYMANEALRRGWAKNWEQSLIVGNYHSGPLSLIIPFGIFGVLGFIWFIVAALQFLNRNYKFGEARLRNFNTFLLALFITRIFQFLFVFGAFENDLANFFGLVGLGVALNGGMARRAPAAASIETTNPLRSRSVPALGAT